MYLMFVLRKLQENGVISNEDFMEINDLLTLHQCLEGKMKKMIPASEYQMLVEISDKIRNGIKVDMSEFPGASDHMKRAVQVAQSVCVQ